MRFLTTIVLITLVSGCSSFSTQLSKSQNFAKSVYLAEPIPEVFGGIRLNAEMAAQSLDSEAGLFGLVYVLIDTPLSLIADTVLLPYTLTKGSDGAQNEPQQ